MRKYNAMILSRERIDSYWKHIEPFLMDGLFMCEGELDVKQLRLLAIQGNIQLLVILDMETDLPKGAMALEVVSYPNFRAVNIVSYGGYNLFASEEDFEYLSKELHKSGFSYIQGWCKPAQARLFKSKYKFETPYEMVRFSLTKGD